MTINKRHIRSSLPNIKKKENIFPDGQVNTTEGDLIDPRKSKKSRSIQFH